MPSKKAKDKAVKELLVVRIEIASTVFEMPETISRKPRAKKSVDLEKHLQKIGNFLACIGKKGVAFRIILE
jgi:hypothetical protein